MVAKSEIQFAGEYLLEECRIISTRGKAFDIKDIIEEIIQEEIEDEYEPLDEKNQRKLLKEKLIMLLINPKI